MIMKRAVEDVDGMGIGRMENLSTLKVILSGRKDDIEILQEKSGFSPHYRAFAGGRGYLIMSLLRSRTRIYVKPALLRHKQHYVCSKNSL